MYRARVRDARWRFADRRGELGFDISSKTLPVTPSGWLAMRNRHSESTDEAQGRLGVGFYF